jgi:imidazolonepropionase
MKKLFTNILQLLQIRPSEVEKVSGFEMAALPLIENAWLLIEDDLIADYGMMNDCPQIDAEVFDMAGRIVMPAWIDSHTHLVFAASREDEFVMKIKGKTYEEIAAAGGGILNSAAKLADTDEDSLYEMAAERLRQVMKSGTGAIEIKSGYGLSLEGELKMLKVVKKLKENFRIPIKATLLAAHALPKEFKENREAFIRLILDEMIPQVVENKLAEYIDVFCENGFFTTDETDRILKQGIKYGLIPKIHANQLSVSGGVQVGVANGALSVDHLEEIGEQEIECLLNSETMPVALPGCSFFLGIPFTPGRKIIDAGLPLCVASDYNPGSSPGGNMNFVVSLACIKMKLTPEEAINAATINAAYALGLSKTHGSITKGKKASLIVTEQISSYNFIPYSYSRNVVDKMLVDGEFVQ